MLMFFFREEMTVLTFIAHIINMVISVLSHVWPDYAYLMTNIIVALIILDSYLAQRTG